MKLCVVTFKECWRDASGTWVSSGGFSLQMEAIGSLFDEMTLAVIERKPAQGGIPLPRQARVIPLRSPAGADVRRKLSVAVALPYYLKTILRWVMSADVVHAPLPGDVSFLGMLAALALRKRLIARYGGSWGSTSQTTRMNRITKAVMRRFAGGRNVMLATGLGSQPPAKNMHWIFVSVISQAELSQIRPDFERAPQSPLNLAYVGRLSEEKGVDILVRAMSMLRQERSLPGNMPCLTIIGDGPQKAKLAALIEAEKLGSFIRFTGQVDRDDLFRWLQKTDICVLPSLTESFGKARLDAMMCGVPVITTEVGFGREIVGQDGERGWLAPSGDPLALAETLRSVITGAVAWPAVRRRCRQYAERFTLENWTQSIGTICAQQWGISLVEGKFQL